MNTQQVAEKLVALFNSGDMEAPYKELYSPNVISREQGEPFKQVQGMEEMMKKGAWWNENFEVHSASMSDPVVADEYFSVSITMDTTHKPSGVRETMTEIGVYKVEGGMIVWEEFFYKNNQEM